MDNLSPDTALAIMTASQTQSTDRLQELKGIAKLKDANKIDAAAKDFEAMFITEMMKPMFEGLEVDEMFGGGKTEEVFRGFMLQEYGKMIAETGQLGIADAVKAEMIRMQEAAEGNTDTTNTTEG